VETLRRSEGATGQEALAARTKLADAVAQLGAARARREIARLDLERTRIRTPVAGVVASVSTQEGETVASTFTAPTFVTIVDPRQLECVALVDETDIGRVRPGASAEFTVDAYPGRTFTGVVTRIAPDATVVSGVVDYEVTIRITDGTELLKPQMTATVGILSGAKRALVVPSTAVRQGAEGPYVWRVRGGRPTPVPVTAGTRQLDLTEVGSGISAGDSVLTAGFPDFPAPGGSASS
jgi:RND family efflux transporter MFP subunit